LAEPGFRNWVFPYQKKNFQYKNAKSLRFYKTIQIKDIPCNKKKLQLFIIPHVSISKSPLIKVFAPAQLVLYFSK
jgi:hypothetical protein